MLQRTVFEAYALVGGQQCGKSILLAFSVFVEATERLPLHTDKPDKLLGGLPPCVSKENSTLVPTRFWPSAVPLSSVRRTDESVF